MKNSFKMVSCNLSEPSSPDFPKSEYDLRWKRARELMEKQNIDALLISEFINFKYFTGHYSFMHGSKTRPMCLILQLRGEPISILPGAGEGPKQQDTSWVKESRTYES